MEGHRLSLPQTLTAVAAIITALTGLISLFHYEENNGKEQMPYSTVRLRRDDLSNLSPPKEDTQGHRQISRDGQNNINGANIQNSGTIIYY